jgi:hypothetical protein
MSEKKIAELESRIEFLENIIVEAYYWVGVKPVTAGTKYRKLMKDIAEARLEIISRE